MLDKRDSSAIKKDLELLSRGKIEAMKQAREVVKASKQLIYAIHRADLKATGEHEKAIKSMRAKLDTLANDERIKCYGPYKNAIQEYVEALAYHQVVSKGRIPTRAELGADTETYLMGLSDLTGELMRKGIKDVIDGRPKDAVRMRDVVEEIYGLVLELDLDGGEARKKTDQVKYALARLEDVVYDAKIRDKI